MKSLVENYADYLIAGGVAAVGGMMRIITTGGAKSVASVIAEMTVAGFAGVLINALLLEFDVDHEIKIFCVGVAGYSAREIIELMRQAGVGFLKSLIARMTREGGGNGGKAPADAQENREDVGRDETSSD